MNVREGSPADASVLVAFDHVAQHDTHRTTMIEHALAEGRVLLAEREKEIAGFLLHSDRLLGHPLIELIYVRDTTRRQGIASLLICEHLRSSRDRSVFTTTNESNTPARQLFERVGFVTCGRIEGLDEGDPEIVLRWQQRNDASGSG